MKNVAIMQVRWRYLPRQVSPVASTTVGDLADVDTTTLINVNDLVIPVNVAPIVLDQVIDLDSENIGTVRYGDKEFYAFHQSGDFPQRRPHPYPLRVKVTAPEIKGNSTSIEQIIGDQKGPRKASPFEGACFSYEIMHPIGDDFEYSADDIDHSIVAVNSVRTSPFSIPCESPYPVRTSLRT